MRKSILIMLATVILSNSLYGLEAGEASGVSNTETRYSLDDITRRTHEIGSVRVTGDKPVKDAVLNYSILDSTSLKESSNVSFAELLSKHSHIFVKTYGLGSIATVSFRGTGASHTQVEWNGIPINNPMLGQVDFSQIPVWFADKVELYYGGSSLALGSGALGGAVVINSMPEWGRRFYGAAAQSVGSYGTYQTFVSAGGGNQTVHARVRYLYERAENNFRFKSIGVMPGNPWMRQRDADYSKHGAMADIYWRAGGGNLFSLNVWFNTGIRHYPPLMSANQSQRHLETSDDTGLRAVLGWNRHWQKIRLKFTSGFQFIDNDYTDNNIGAGNMLVNTGSIARGFLNRFNAEFDLASNTMVKLTLSMDYHRASVIDRKQKTRNKPDRVEFGYSAGIYHHFSGKLNAYALLGGGFTDSKADPLTPSVGFEYKPLDSGDLFIKLNGTRNYHRPTLNDLYWMPGGNPDLKPEKGYTADLVAGYGRNIDLFAYTVSFTGYISRIHDWIVWEPSAGLNGAWSPRNKKEVLSRGVETYASFSYEKERFRVSLSGNYAYTRSTNERVYMEGDQSKGKQLIYIPLHKASVMLDVEYGGWYLWWVMSYVGERFTTSSNETSFGVLPEYDLHDATLGHKFTWKGIKIDLQGKVNNVLGRIYRPLPSRPMPLQYFTFLIKIHF